MIERLAFVPRVVRVGFADVYRASGPLRFLLWLLATVLGVGIPGSVLALFGWRWALVAAAGLMAAVAIDGAFVEWRRLREHARQPVTPDRAGRRRLREDTLQLKRDIWDRQHVWAVEHDRIRQLPPGQDRGTADTTFRDDVERDYCIRFFERVILLRNELASIGFTDPHLDQLYRSVSNDHDLRALVMALSDLASRLDF